MEPPSRALALFEKYIVPAHPAIHKRVGQPRISRSVETDPIMAAFHAKRRPTQDSAVGRNAEA